ncbi:polyketide synthase 12 [Nocardia amikacinitolerans]|uniref:type I polyketide synthase n=1 Tax=Nocardia amikacinitolerans TaxID=756689 RepID=UPI002646C13F|nr:type I polyketide synthase [Nocardia amikacinitolerans]MCP2294152.1 polyketide synthase 12 [Nocardia amikacinitolerans]
MARDYCSDDSVGIVGMACRFPGGIDSPESLWQFLVAGKHTSSKFPGDRAMTELADMASPEVAAAMAPMGGFIDEPGQFDPEFFGISPREAKAMDPQQRMVLETAWQAIEDARIDADRLRGSDTGVYIGAMGGDYAYLIPGQKDLDPGYVSLGVSQSVLSGRVSYILGLQGPTMSVDTACSSSLVAMHLAARALKSGECSLALAGGVSIMSTLTGFYALGQHGAISKEGRSRPYSADADGFCMSEGVAVLVLERLSDARRNGHEVLAVLRGGAINQDGATKGLTVPSTEAQRKLIGAALADAELRPEDIDMVEGHGTGTPVGDPIELAALFDTFGPGRPDGRPLLLGSVKGNFGHTQAAAGAAGVIKVVESMRRAAVPGTVNFAEPTSAVDWSSGAIEVPVETVAWPERDRPRRAGVSSFGIAGTNAHVILEQAPPAPAEPARPTEGAALPIAVLPVSGRTPEALAAQAGALARHIQEHPEFGLHDVGYALGTTRTAFEHRAVVLGANRVDVLAGLAAVAESRPVGPIRGQSLPDRRVCFVFPGQGAQYAGMGARLIRESPVFAAEIRACEEAFAEFVDWSLTDVLNEVDGAPTLDRVDVVQPALFATMVSLAALWRSVGIEPEAVLGHSQGEVAAAYVAGALSLADAARIVTMRSKPLRALPGSGGMASINAPAARVRELMSGVEDIHVAAINSPSTTVIAGGADAVARVVAAAEREGSRAKVIPVDYAAHTDHVDPLREQLEDAVRSVSPRSSSIRFFSTVTADELDTANLGPEYWFRNLREPVQFDEGLQAAFQSGYNAFIEMSVNPVLTSAVHESLDHVGPFAESCLIVGSLKREDAGMERFLTSVAEAHVKGVSPDWSLLYPAGTARSVPLPTYAFQRQKYWLSSVAGSGGGKPSGLGLADAGHPLLGAVAENPGADRFLFSTRLSLATHGWLADHALHGNVLVPGAMLLELALHAGDKLGTPRVAKLTMYTPVTLPAEGAVQLQLTVGELERSGRRKVAIYSRPENTDEAPGQVEWSLHADGQLTAAAEPDDTEAAGLELWPPVGAQSVVEPANAYQTLAALGYQYGPVFQGMKAVWKRGEDVFAEVALPDQVPDADKFGLHPALLDAAMQSVAASAALLPSEPGSLALPFAWERVELRAVGARALRCKLTPAGADRVRWVLADTTGQVVAAGTLQVRSVSVGKLATRGLAERQDSLFGVEWLATPVQRVNFTAAHGEWVIVGEPPLGIACEAELPSYPDLDALRADMAAGAAAPKVVLLPRMAASAGGEPGAHLNDMVRTELASVLKLMQSWLADERFTETKLVVLARGVQSVGAAEDISDMVGATVWALVRSAQSEYQDRIVQIDVDETGISLERLAAALHTDEPELALRRGDFYARRIRSGLESAVAQGTRLAGQWRLEIPATGNLDDIALSESAEPDDSALAPGTVVVSVRAAGLSFPVALTGLDAPAGRPARLVHEAAGVVIATAPDVTRFAPGAEVFGLFDEIAATSVVDQRLLAPVPTSWSFAQAAAAPVGYVTALHALRDVAGARRGEKVLVHAATGGVGMAALNVAAHLGLDSYATAAEPKWDALRGMGFGDDRIASSRSGEFAARFAGAGGFDIVLDLLPDVFTEHSLGLLGGSGRFVEIARDVVRDPDQVRTAHGVDYASFELGDLAVDTLAGLLVELADLFERGDLAPLPLTRFDVRHAATAVRHLSEAEHIGKVVLTWPRPFDPDDTVLITGGTGTIGAIIARHMVSAYGARHLVLTSRSGERAEGVAELVAELAEAGARVTVAQCDAGDRDALRAVLDAVPAEHPLGAVIHLAAALADAAFDALTDEHLDTVLPAKVGGAWYLHELTEGADLSMFVLFSSAAGTFGNAGQANYGAANVFLDTLARHRYHRGLPATSMAWGWWSEDTSNTGKLDEKDRARLRRMGVTPIPTGQALALFDAALSTGRPNVLPIGMDLSLLRVAASVAELPPFFRALLHTRPRATQQMGDASQLAKRLSGLSPAEQHEVVVELLKTPISMVLGYSSPDAVQPDREFTELGIDSLSSIELGAHLRAMTGVKLANSVIFQYPTVNLLARHVLEQVTPQDAELSDPIVAEVEMLLDRLAALHEDREVPEDLLRRLTTAVGRIGAVSGAVL